MKSTELIEGIKRQTFRLLVCALGLLLILALAKGGLPAAFADEITTDDGVLTYTLNEAGTEATITGCDTGATDKQVEDAFDEICTGAAVSITSIGNKAFNGCAELTSITIPDSVTSIGEYAFSGCKSLTSVNIPNNVTNMGMAAFSGCTGLTSVSIPNSVKNIRDAVFSGCTGLTSIEISDGVTSIGQAAFSGCAGLMEINLPDSLTRIGNGAFYGCSGLTSIYIPAKVNSIDNTPFIGCAALTKIAVDSNNLYFANDEYGVLFDKARTMLLRYPAGNNQSSYIILNGVTEIAANAFSSCTELINVTIADSVVSMGGGVFSGCTGLTSVNIPDSVTSIEDSVFSGCAGITSINIPEGVTSIGKRAFYGCTGLTNINIPEGVMSIGDSVFFDCIGLTSINIPEGVTSVEDFAFSGCTGLKSINIPDGVTSIGRGAFFGCTGLTSINIPVGVTSIGNNAFSSCESLTSINVPDGVTSIGSQVFSGCSLLTYINIPDDATSIGRSAFEGCTGLTSINIPSGITSIDTRAFYNCRNLTEIFIEHGMLDLPIYFLTETTFRNDLRLSVPTSVISVGGQPAFSFDLPTDTTLSKKPIIYGVTESFIVAWAEANAANGVKLLEINGKINRTDYDDAWRNVPYQHIIETAMPDNFALKFKIVGGELPNGLDLMQKGAVYEGLTLLSGQFYGAPLEAGEFEIEVEVRIDVDTWNYLLDWQKITLNVNIPNDAVLLDTVNDYDITTSIGAISPDDGFYWVTEVEEQVFTVADVDLNDDGKIDKNDSNFPYFVHFWIDGNVMNPEDYDANEGSTVVTIYAKTFQALDDGQMHTASAEFSIKGVQTVAAQNFRVNLPEPEPEEKPDPEPEPKPDTDLNTDPDPEPEPGSDPEPDPEQEPNTDPDPDTEPEPDLDPNTDTDTAPEQNTPLPGGTSGGGYMASAPAQPGPEPDAPTVLPAPVDTDAADETPVAPVIAPEIPAIVAEDTGAAVADTSPAGTTGAVAIDGLPRDANGLFYFVLDGSDAPLEARIDIPLTDFADMYFDGALWTPDEDYAVREGSTIIVIAAEKLADFAYGMHEISARFTEDRTVAFAFDLRGPAPAAGSETGPVTPAEDTANAVSALAAGSGIPAAPFVIVALAIVLLIAAALIFRARRLRRAG
jgi:hypothetical protein